jgi:hypothetical protein
MHGMIVVGRNQNSQTFLLVIIRIMPPNNFPRDHVKSKSSQTAIPRPNLVKSFDCMLGIHFMTSFKKVWMDQGQIIMSSEPQMS